MATTKELKEYNEHVARCLRNAKAHKVLNVLTGVIGLLWPVAIAGLLLAWTFTTFLNTSTMNNVAKIFTCLGVSMGAAVLVAMGIICPVKAYYEIDWQESISLGVCLIIFAGVVPGVLYLVTRYLAGHSSVSMEDPIQRDKDNKEKERKAKDARKYFTEDDEDVGKIPDINPLDFEELKGAIDAEEESKRERGE